ncbi:MAG: inosine/xanthosine triphosphatase [Nitrososphaerota archaeon]|nr:inosine/xanthosine triphosphatase [Nitrososphaerota archaeon]
MVKKVAVGSTNRVKAEAARLAFGRYFEVDVLQVDADSGVAKQPVGADTFKGAANRARAAVRLGRADYGVGIEGGIMEMDGRRMAFAAVCILSSSGRESMATSGFFPLPREALSLIDRGMELGEAMDAVSRMKDTKKGPGAVGLLTGGKIDRVALYEHAVILAIIPHLNDAFSW